MPNSGKVTIGDSKSLMTLIVIQKVHPMARGRISSATLLKTEMSNVEISQAQKYIETSRIF
jgi:hypothetical protein